MVLHPLAQVGAGLVIALTAVVVVVVLRGWALKVLSASLIMAASASAVVRRPGLATPPRRSQGRTGQHHHQREGG